MHWQFSVQKIATQWKSKATMRRWEEDHSPRDIKIWFRVRARWERKDLLSKVWLTVRRKRWNHLEQEKKIFWGPLLPSVLSEMFLWLNRTGFGWRNQRSFLIMRLFSVIWCNQRFSRTAETPTGDWFSTGSMGIPCPSTADAGVLIEHEGQHISVISAWWCADISILAGVKVPIIIYRNLHSSISFVSLWTGQRHLL